MVENLPAIQESWVQLLGGKDPVENGMATHFSILAWNVLLYVCDEKGSSLIAYTLKNLQAMQ